MSGFDSIQPFSAEQPEQPEQEIVSTFDQQQAQPDEGVNWLDWHDPITAPLRGVEGMVHGVYNFADYLFGVLPDWDDQRLLGQSKSIGGQFITGMSQFLAAFIPVVGVMSRGAQFGNITRGLISQGVRGKGMLGLGKVSIPGARRLHTFAGKNLRQKPGFGKRLLMDSIAGAAVDFTVYDGHESRLSNLLRTHFELDDPVTKFLAADEDDHQLIARLKGAIEGIGLGILADSMIHVLGRMKRVRKMREDGATPEQIDKADREGHLDGSIEDALKKDRKADGKDGVDQTPPDQLPDDEVFQKYPSDYRVTPGAKKKLDPVILKLRRARAKMVSADTELAKAEAGEKVRKLEMEVDGILREDELKIATAEAGPEFKDSDFETVQAKGETFEQAVIDGETYRIRYDKDTRRWVDHDTGEFVTEPREGKAVAARKIRERRAREIAAEKIETGEPVRKLVEDTPDPTPRKEYQALPMKEVKEVLGRLRVRLSQGDNAINPRDIDPAELIDDALRELGDNGLNLSTLDEETAAVLRALEDLVEEVRAPDTDPVTWEMHRERGFQEVKEILGMTGDETPLSMYDDIELGKAGKALATEAEKDLSLRRKMSNRLIAWRVLLTHHSREFLKKGVAAAEASSETAERALAELAATHARMMAAHKAVSGFASISGRDLNAHKIPFAGFERLQQMLKRGGEMSGLMDMAKMLKEMGDNPVAAAKLAREAERSVTFMKITMEWWINAILGGGRTLSINFISGAMMSVYRPFEKMIGAVLTGNMPGAKEAMLEFTTYSQRFQIATKFGWQAARNNNPILLAGGKMDEFGYSKSLTPQGMKDALGKLGKDFDPNSSYGRIIGRMGSFFRYPTAVLIGTDELVKQANWYASAEATLRRMAASGAMTDGGEQIPVEKIAGWASKKVDDLVYHGQAINQEVLYRKYYDQIKEAGTYDNTFDIQVEAMKKAKTQWESKAPQSVLERLVLEDASRVAEETTFTKAIPADGTFGESVTAMAQTLVRKHPVLRFFATFIQTPANILFWARDRTLDPVVGMARAVLSDEIRGIIRDGSDPRNYLEVNKIKNRWLRDVMGDLDLQGLERDSEGAKVLLQQRKEEAVGRMAVGMGMSTTFIGFAAAGVITGRGPTDKEQRDILTAAGWRPYSIKVGNSYIEYRRLDPFATILGTAADMITLGKYAPEQDTEFLQDNMKAFIVSLANNSTNKTYMTGIKNLTELLSDPEGTFPRIWPRFASSFVPTGPADAINWLAGDHDPLMREVRGPIEAMLEKAIPYYGQSIDPVRNVLGEPVRRITSMGYDAVGELANLFVPIAYGEVTDDFIGKELAGLNHSFTPPQTVQANVELRDFTNDRGQSAYDRMMQIRGEQKHSGVSLRKALRQLIRSDSYQRMDPESTLEYRSPRVDAINSVIQRYHRSAIRQMRREFPEVQVRVDAIRRERAYARYSALKDIR